MSDIQLIVNIPEEDYISLQRKDKFNDMLLNYYEKLIVHGKPLPKGHGRIGDLDAAHKEIEDYQDLIRSVGKFDADKASALTLLGRCKELINGVDTLIEADKEK